MIHLPRNINEIMEEIPAKFIKSLKKEKLIRDELGPIIIEEEGVNGLRVAPNNKVYFLLISKLYEETLEVCKADTVEEVLNEIADVQEVLEKILDHLDIREGLSDKGFHFGLPLEKITSTIGELYPQPSEKTVKQKVFAITTLLNGLLKSNNIDHDKMLLRKEEKKRIKGGFDKLLVREIKSK